MTETTKKPRGFQNLSAEERKRIASMGGKAAHANGFAHHFTPEEAKKAARKGWDKRLPKIIPTTN